MRPGGPGEAKRLAAWATTVIVGTNRNGLQFRSFDKTQRNAQIMKPLLQLAIHKAPLREKPGSQSLLITH
ncbi:hypothetical protein SAMN05216597_2792 [Pseudomonas cannabina]|nr:hypothetical protein SAMN05216597_2792 [Pseudomonas cannabina]